MTPAVRALAAALLGALLVVPAWSWPAHATTTPASPSASPTDSPTDGAGTDGPVIFTGRFAQPPKTDLDGPRPVYRYQVTVDRVFSPDDVVARRVTVRSFDDLETCRPRRSEGGQGLANQGQATESPSGSLTESSPGATDTPTTGSDTAPTRTVDKSARVFLATLVDNEYVVTCDDVVLVDDTVTARLARDYGEGRAPGRAEEPTVPLEEVGYECPGTGEPVDLDDRASCDSLADGQSFDRTAAPGLALVIVGMLGWLLARRLGRTP